MRFYFVGFQHVGFISFIYDFSFRLFWDTTYAKLDVCFYFVLGGFASRFQLTV